MRFQPILILFAASCCPSRIPDFPEPKPFVSGFRDQTIDLDSIPPKDSVLAIRGDFEVLVSREAVARLLADTSMIAAMGAESADSIRESIRGDLERGAAPQLRAIEDSDLRDAENVLLDGLLRLGEGYIWDRVGRRPFTFVFASGNGICQTDDAHVYWVSDGRKLFQVHFLGSWCPHPA